MAVASTGPHANHLHLAPDSTSSLNQMVFLTPNQHCQSTEDHSSINMY